MSGFDTDPKMMRGQQDKDTPETIEADERAAKTGRSDLDAASRRDREAAKAPEGEDAASANETMDDVFNENRAAAGSGRTADRMMEDTATDGSASLAQTDRSLLGR